MEQGRPLSGKRILITRPAEQAPGLAALLEAQGAAVVTLSTIRIEPLGDISALDRAIQQRACYHWIIFTSVNGVQAMQVRLDAAGLDWQAFKGAKLAAIGPATAEALCRAGAQPDFVPSEYIAEAIAAGIGEVAGQRILLPRADIAREALAVELRKRGAEVDEMAAYRTVTRSLDAEAVRAALAERLDVITFTSSSTVRGFLAGLGEQKPDKVLRGVVVACIGPITAQTARAFGLAPQIVAGEYTMPGLVRAIVAYFTASESRTTAAPL